MGILEQLGISGGDSETRYGDVPFGLRLALAAQAASAMDKGQVADVSSGLAAMAQLQQNAVERRRADALTQKQQDMANRLADKIEATNPAYADALRADPSLVNDYMKNDLNNQQWQKQYDVQRKDQLSDFAAQQEAATKAAQAKRAQELEDLRVENERKAAEALAKQEFEMNKQNDQQEFDLQKWNQEQQAKNAAQAAQSATLNYWQNTAGKGVDMPGPVQPGQRRPDPTGYNIPLAGTDPRSGVTATNNPKLDTFRGMFSDPNLTDAEASRLNVAATTGEKLGDEYAKIVSARPSIQKTQVLDTPKLPKDYAWKDPAAAEKGDYSAGMNPIPGSAAELELKQNAQKLKKAEERKAIEKSAYGRAVKRAITLIDEGESGDTLPTAGLAGSVLKYIPGTAATSLQSELTTITGNLGLDKLQAMREAAAAAGGTGASGLGSVTDYENRLLQSTIEALNQNEHAVPLRERLVRLDNMVEAVVDGTLMKDTAQLKELMDAAQSPSEKAQLVKYFEEEYGPGSAEQALAQ